jgi:N-acetylmuramoyl-L-alanine amidase
VCVLGTAALGAAGCQDSARAWDPSRGEAIQGPLTVHELAEQFGLAVSAASRTIATLRNQNNVVLLYADPWGSVYVNGSQIPATGGIVAADDTLYIPARVVVKIRENLRPLGDDAPRREVASELPKEPPARPPPEPGKPVGRVVLDPGHGGKDAGAISVLGFREKDLVLRVALATAEELRRQNVEVVMTRNDDRFIELEDRPAVADRVKADVFVSIHADSAPRNNSACGFTAYVGRSAGRSSSQAAQGILGRLCGTGAGNRGVRQADFRVLILSRCPAVLMEVGFLSNRAEAGRLSDAGYQRRLGVGLAGGIVDFLKKR